MVDEVLEFWVSRSSHRRRSQHLEGIQSLHLQRSTVPTGNRKQIHWYSWRNVSTYFISYMNEELLNSLHTKVKSKGKVFLSRI